MKKPGLLNARALPRDVATAKTMLVWREGYRSGALDAFKAAVT